MQIDNSTHFANNYARAAAYYLGTCAPAPKGGDEKRAYELITGMYEAIIKDAEGVGFKTSPETTFRPWEQQRGRENDVKLIREPIAKIEALIAELFELVDSGEAEDCRLLLAVDAKKPKKHLLNMLAAAGAAYEKTGERACFVLPSGCARGLKRLIEVSKSNIIHITDGPKEDKAYLYFSRAVFDPDENWTAQAFDRYLKADGRLIALAHALEARGYTRIDCRDGKKISLDYVKEHGKKPEKVKQSWGERTHTGIEVSYEELVVAPCYLWLRVPMYKTVLERMSELPDGVRAFMRDNTKTCDGCRYCVQTDKTKTRPLASVSIDGKKKCPYFPGFTFNWRELDEKLMKEMISAVDALDELLG